ncbi:MAG: hypothetical protein QM804_18145 [Propionicimonas sp.]
MDFDLDRSVSEAWAGFTERLAEVVSVMDPDATLTLGSLGSADRGQSPFVVFTCLPDRRLLVQASGNQVLGEGYQLGLADLQRLDDLGWQPPSVDGPHPGPHHWVELAEEENEQAAARAVTVLRDVFGVRHPAFLAADQLAEVLAPPTPREAEQFHHEDLQAVVPGSLAELEAMVRAELGQVLGYEPLTDSDGDFAIRVGSAMVFVRCTPDAREVLVFSPLVHELEGRGRAMEVLSDLNTQARYLRFLLIRDRVFASMSVLAHPFVPAHLHQALQTMTMVADELDGELAQRLRGRTSFGAVD